MKREPKAEPIAQYECSAHKGSCGKCPSCKRHSYCKMCLECRVCGYPPVNISETHKEGHRFWVQKVEGLYYAIEDRQRFAYNGIEDRWCTVYYSPKAVFAPRYKPDYDDCRLFDDERAQVITEVGYENCIAILEHYFQTSHRSHLAKEYIDRYVK
jgi:hypothetical protein